MLHVYISSFAYTGSL